MALVLLLKNHRLYAVHILLALFIAGWGVAGPFSAQAQTVEPAGTATVSQKLEEMLAKSDGPVSFLVILQDQPDLEAVQSLIASGVESRTERTALLYNTLTQHAAARQTDLRALLDRDQIPYRPYYIVNMIAVEGDAEVVALLRAHPDVARLEANPEVSEIHQVRPTWWSLPGRQSGPVALQSIWGDQGQDQQHNLPHAANSLPWGLTYTQAPAVWALGYAGRGIVVASQDTGVEWDHPALKSRYRGWNAASNTADHLYNWFDAWGSAGRPARCSSDPQIPCDDNGHGTHTVGTMLGSATNAVAQVGMAPEATWIGCRNMRNGFGTPASYTACFEFFLAPYPQGGDPFTQGRPELSPDIINNSWGCPPYEGCDESSLRQVVETVRAAGIFVIASAGNSGSACSTVRDPIALHDATFTIGAHSSNGDLASFSSRGPVTIDGSQRLKPDIAAPGVSVYSASVNGGYGTSSGTSMASPHVAGAAALLWSAVPGLVREIDLSEQVLVKSATSVLINQCSTVAEAVTPNNLFGYGRLNALAAVQMAQAPARVNAEARDCTDRAIPNAQVFLEDLYTRFIYTDTTKITGIASLAPIYARTDDLFSATVHAPGHVFSPANVKLAMGETSAVALFPSQCTSTTGGSYVVTLQRASPDWISEGGVVSFSVRITNTGETPITTLPLTYTFDPAYLSLVSALPKLSSADAAAGNIIWEDLTNSDGFGEPLAPGQSFVISVEFSAQQSTLLLEGGMTRTRATVPDAWAEDGVRVVTPTSVGMASLAVEPTDSGVLLRWTTADEAQMKGFRLHRQNPDGSITLLTREEIPAKEGQLNGAEYDFLDTLADSTAVSGGDYRYELEVIGMSGSANRLYMGAFFKDHRLFFPSIYHLLRE
jgi:serine protease AprX